jgi:RNA polymerase sigma-70 factor, ECF subfamily
MDEIDLRNSLAALHPASFAWAVVCCRDRELAEEVLQSVYARLLDGHAPHDGRSSFQTWLFAVIRNAARDQQRKRWWSRVLRLELNALDRLAGATQRGSSPANDEDELAIVRAALRTLPERQRQVVHLVFYEELTVVEAATVMGVTVGTARQHYARAKESLKVILRPLRNRMDESISR